MGNCGCESTSFMNTATCGCENTGFVNTGCGCGCGTPTPARRTGGALGRIFGGACNSNFLLLLFLVVLMASNCGGNDNLFFVIILAVIFTSNCGMNLFGDGAGTGCGCGC